MVPLFIHLVNVLLQNRFTCNYLMSKFFTQPAFGVQASYVVDAGQGHTSDAETAASAQLDFITLSMACMVHVYYVLQVTIEYNGQQVVSWSGQTTWSKARPSRMYPARIMSFIYLTRKHLQQSVLPSVPYTNKYNTNIIVQYLTIIRRRRSEYWWIFPETKSKGIFTIIIHQIFLLTRD